MRLCFPNMIMALVALLALLLLAITLQDAFEVMLLPRRVMRRLRFVGLFYRLTWFVWSALAYRLPRDGQREHVLGVYGALSLVLLFGIWISCLILGFGLLLWAAQVGSGVTPRPTLGAQLYMSGVTFFTLGYGDLVPGTRIARLLSVLEAGTGLGFIAVVIGYLPVLYQLFTRREAHVIKLDGRAAHSLGPSGAPWRRGWARPDQHAAAGVGDLGFGAPGKSSLLPDARLLSVTTSRSVLVGGAGRDHGLLCSDPRWAGECTALAGTYDVHHGTPDFG
jgi:hypothetical protein